MAKKKSASKDSIVDGYMTYVLSADSKPKSVYAFAKEIGISEASFYEHFSSFYAIEKHIFQSFFKQSINLLEKDESYLEFDSKNKLLSFYFTFFEVLKANRSYVVFALQHNKNALESLKSLSELRTSFKLFVDSLEIETINLNQEWLTKLKNNSLSELAWAQLLIVLKFWLEDESAKFEKTDLFIEKSIQASFDLIDVSHLASIVDLGKFLFKEKIKPML